MNEPEDPSEREATDLGRRTFFRHFGRSAVQAVGQVVGAADALRRGSSEAASELLRLASTDPDDGREGSAAASGTAVATPIDAGSQPRSRSAGPTRRVGTAEPRGALARMPGESAAYRSPYRIVDGTLILVDRRSLPQDIAEMECRVAGDVARAIRAGAVRGGPLLAQVAAYGLALTADRLRDRPVPAQLAQIDEAAAVLRRADPSARAMLGALGRVQARLASLGEGATADVIADVLRAEADAIASEATMDHAALARHGAALLTGSSDGPLRLLLHGPLGPMDAGMVGTGLGILQSLAAASRTLEVWVTEGRPTLDGARVTTWELDQMGIAYSVLPDSAVTWLLDHTVLDAILLGAEWIAADGDTASVMGSGAIAALANARTGVPLPVYVCAPTASIGLDAPDSEAIPRSAATRATARAAAAPAASRAVVAPTLDVVRARHITAFVTEEGALRPPFASSLPRAVESRAHRRTQPPPAVAATA